MRCLVQRVNYARVSVDGEVVGAIDEGLMVLVGVGHDDTIEDAQWLANKVEGLRIFGQSAMNDSVADIGGGVLAISQFTLYGNCEKGRRPSFIKAAHPDHGKALYEAFCDALTVPTQRGIFGAYMDIDMEATGPVTIMLERTNGVCIS